MLHVLHKMPYDWRRRKAYCLPQMIKSSFQHIAFFLWPAALFTETSLLRRGSKGFFFVSGGLNPVSNVSAGTELQATVESPGASARYHTQDGRHPEETISCALLPGVACVTCVTVKSAGKILRFSDV